MTTDLYTLISTAQTSFLLFMIGFLVLFILAEKQQNKR